MINLLPLKEKEQLIFESNKKLTIVLGNMVLISLISLVLVLFSLKFYILEQFVYQEGNLSNIEKDYQNEEFVSIKNDMEKYNDIIVKMNNFYNKQVYISDGAIALSGVEKPKGLYFRSMYLENQGDKDINVKITGFSNTRENLQSFKDNIERIQEIQPSYKIENIYFPPYVWLKSKDIDFNVTFKMVKNEPR